MRPALLPLIFVLGCGLPKPTSTTPEPAPVALPPKTPDPKPVIVPPKAEPVAPVVTPIVEPVIPPVLVHVPTELEIYRDKCARDRWAKFAPQLAAAESKAIESQKYADARPGDKDWQRKADQDRYAYEQVKANALKFVDNKIPLLAAERGDAGILENFGAPVAFTIFQVIDGQNVLVKYGTSKYFFWVEGIDTRDMVDGHAFNLTQVVTCVGPKRYTSAIGATKSVTGFRLLK
jgi:hypothetical protein